MLFSELSFFIECLAKGSPFLSEGVRVYPVLPMPCWIAMDHD